MFNFQFAVGKESSLPELKKVSDGFLMLSRSEDLFLHESLQVRLEAFALLISFYNSLDFGSRAIMRYVMDGNREHLEPMKISRALSNSMVLQVCHKFTVYYTKFISRPCSKRYIALCIAGVILGERPSFFKQFFLDIRNDEIGFLQYLVEITGFQEKGELWQDFFREKR